MYWGIGFLFHISEGLTSHLRVADLHKRKQGAAGCLMRALLHNWADAERSCRLLATLALVEDDGAWDGSDYAD